MKKLFDFILESLINSSELNEKLEFIEISKEELKKILDTDDYQHGKVLNLNNIDDFNNIWLIEYGAYYKISYDNKCIGVFSFLRPNDLLDIVKDSDNNNQKYTDKIFMKFLYCPLIINTYTHKYKDELIFNSNDLKIDDDLKQIIDNQLKDNNFFYSKKYDNIIIELYKNVGYIGVWAINQNIKKKLDINDFALVKVFFNKLLKLCKDNKCKYIFAHGKDPRTQKMYIKLGGFKSFEKSLDTYFDTRNKENLLNELSKGFLGKEI